MYTRYCNTQQQNSIQHIHHVSYIYGDSPPFSVRPSFENHMGTTVPNLGWDPPQIWGRRRPEKFGIPHKQQKTTHSLS